MRGTWVLGAGTDARQSPEGESAAASCRRTWTGVLESPIRQPPPNAIARFGTWEGVRGCVTAWLRACDLESESCAAYGVVRVEPRGAERAALGFSLWPGSLLVCSQMYKRMCLKKKMYKRIC